MAAAAILKNRKIMISRPRFERFQRHLAQWRSSTLSTLTNGKNFKFQKYKMAAATTLKHLRTPYLSHGSSDFAEIWHTDAVPPSWPFRLLRIWNFLNPGWRRPPSWKIEKSPHLGRSSRHFDEIWHSDAVRLSWPFWPLKISISKIQHGSGRHLQKSKNHHISAAVQRNLAQWCCLTLLTVPTVAKLKCWKCKLKFRMWFDMHSALT